ncbi:MAG: nucleoside phosphorylase [Saprospiraceae bacterium]
MEIKESELVLTEDKRIYHLGLHPEQLGDYIITVGDPQRVEKVSQHFDTINYINQKREFLTHTGTLGKKSISVIGTGIGPDNIDILLNEIDALKNIDLNTREIKKEKSKLKIIRLGTSGSLNPEIPTDTIVASQCGLGFDGLLNFYDYNPEEYQISAMEILQKEVPELFTVCKPYIFKGSKFLLDNLGDDIIKGITLTAGGFYGPQGRMLRLNEKMRYIIEKISLLDFNGTKITNFEMETSAIYGLSHLLGMKLFLLMPS